MSHASPQALRSVPQLVTLSGMDGSGKTIHARMLVKELRRRGIPALYRRIRFPFLLSLPLLIYARLRGFSYTLWAGKTAVGYQGFNESRVLRGLYPWTLYLDLLLATLFCVKLPMGLGCTVVCDRFVLDTMVDLAVALDRRSMLQTEWGRRYSSLTPSGTKAFLLVSGSQVIKERRPELFIDPNFQIRSDLYQQLADSPGLVSLSTEEDAGSVQAQIQTHLSLKPDSAEGGTEGRGDLELNTGWYSYVANSRLPTGLQKVLLLTAHWLFQSVLYMSRSERLLRLLSGAAVFGGVFITLVGPAGIFLAAIVAAFLAHSTNFVLDAHIPAVLKHIDLEVGEDRIREYAKGIRTRASRKPYLQGAIVVGSLARGEGTPSSDLDIRIIPQPGQGNALRASAFTYAERTRALRHMFPLDIYVSEGVESLASLRESRTPVILCDNNGTLSGMFPGGLGPETLDY